MANYQQFMEMRRKEYEAREAEKNTGIIGDLADMAHAGAASSLGGIVDFLGDEKTAQRLYQNADEQYETLTPEMRESMGKEFFGEDEQGLYAGEALTDPRAWAGNLAKVAGGMAPAIVGGGAAGLVGRGLVSTVASGGTNAFLNGAMANGQAADQVRQNVINADMTQLAQNELFKSVVRTFHEQNPDMESAALLENAKLEFAEQAAKVRMYDPASFASNALLGMFGDRAIVGALAKGSKASTVTGAIGRNALIEGGTEFVQEAGDQVATNLVNRDYVDPNTGATDNALSAGLTGAVLGGGMGAAAGGVGHALHGNRGTNVPQNKNITDPATNDTTDVIDSAPQQAEQAPEATGAQPGQVDLTGGTIVPQERTEPVMGDLSGVYEPAPIDPEALDVSSTWDNDEPMIGTIAAPDEPLKGTPIDVSGTQGLGEPVADRETIVPQVDKETQLREQAEAERAAQPPTPELSDPVKGRVEQRAQERMAKIQESAYRADALDDPIEPVGNVGKDEREAERLKDLQLKNNPTRQAKLSKEQAERDKAKADAEAKKRGKFQQNALRDREGERLVPRNDDEYLGKLAQRMLEAQEGKKGAPTVDELLAEAKAEGATQKQVHDAIQAKRAEAGAKVDAQRKEAGYPDGDGFYYVRKDLRFDGETWYRPNNGEWQSVPKKQAALLDKKHGYKFKKADPRPLWTPENADLDQNRETIVPQPESVKVGDVISARNPLMSFKVGYIDENGGAHGTVTGTDEKTSLTVAEMQDMGYTVNDPNEFNAKPEPTPEPDAVAEVEDGETIVPQSETDPVAETESAPVTETDDADRGTNVPQKETKAEPDEPRKPVKPLAKSFDAADFDEDVRIEKSKDGHFDIFVGESPVPVKVHFDAKKKQVGVVGVKMHSYKNGGFKAAKEAALQDTRERVSAGAIAFEHHTTETAAAAVEVKAHKKKTELQRWEDQLAEEQAALAAAKRVVSKLERGHKPNALDVSIMLTPWEGPLARINEENPHKTEGILESRVEKIKAEIAKLASPDERGTDVPPTEAVHVEDGKAEPATPDEIEESLYTAVVNNNRVATNREVVDAIRPEVEKALAAAEKNPRAAEIEAAAKKAKSLQHKLKKVSTLIGAINNHNPNNKELEQHKQEKQQLQEQLDDLEKNALNDYVTFDIKGDGKFKVLNTPDHINKWFSEMQRVANGGSFKTDQTKSTGQFKNNSPKTVLKNFLKDREIENAIQYAKDNGLTDQLPAGWEASDPDNRETDVPQPEAQKDAAPDAVDRGTSVPQSNVVKAGSKLTLPTGEYEITGVELGEHVAATDVGVLVGAHIRNPETGKIAFLTDSELEALGYELEGAADLDREDMADELFMNDGWMARNALIGPAVLGSKDHRLSNELQGVPVLTKSEADARLAEWKRIAAETGKRNRAENSKKTILSLFDSTGEWVKPYKDAGYNVVQFDLNLVNGDGWEMDINNLDRQEMSDMGIDEVHGILAACPCTDFTATGARWWKGKDVNGETEASVALVNQTLAIVEFFKPQFWAVENPVGRIDKLTDVGKPVLNFQPYQLGSDYSKETNLHGRFNNDFPTALTAPERGSAMQNEMRGDNAQDKYDRSTTPEGMAYGFFLANGADRSIESDAWGKPDVTPSVERLFHKSDKFYKWNPEADRWMEKSGDFKLNKWQRVPLEKTAELNKAFGVEFRDEKTIKQQSALAKPTAYKKAKSIKDVLVDNGSILDVVDYLANKSENESYRRIAKQVREYINPNLDLIVVSDGKKLRKPVPTALNTAHAIYAVTNGEEMIAVKDDTFGKGSGISEEVILHELIHAASSLRIREGNLKKNRGSELHKTVGDLYDLQRAVVEHINAKGIELNNQQIAAMNDVSELVAWGMTNTETQKILKGITFKGKTGWSAFVRAVAKMLGIKRSDYTALGELIRITESIMTANDSEVMGDIVNAQVMADDVFPAKTGKSFHELVNVTPTPKSLKERATEAGKKIVDSIQSGVFDRYHALRELDQAMGLDPLQKPELSTWVQARLVGASHGAFKVMMQYGKVAWDQSGVTLDAVKRKAGDKEGFLGELAVLGSEAEIKRFMAWIAANRANNLKDKQSYEERLFTDEQIAEGMAYNQGMMEDGKGRAAVYAKVYKAFNEYHSSVLDIASQSGIISEDARTAWENDFYVPFYRVMDEDKDATFSGILNDGLTKANVIKEIKGSKREIGDLLTNYLVNAQRLIDASMKNAAARKAMEQAMEAGIVSEAGEKSNPTSTTWVMENGQKVKYEFDFTKSVAGQNAHQKEIEVEARAVFEAINALNPIGLNSASLNVMRSFKRVFTNLTTASPAFQVRNLIRDSIQTAATEKGGGKFVKGGKLYGMGGQINHFKARMLASGGAFAFGNNFGDSTQDIMANINGELQAVPVLGLNNVKRSMQQWWRRYSEFSDSVENMNRAAVFDENLGDGLAAAAFRSRDLLDFSAHGAYSGTRILISVVPFLNARLQGLHKLGRHASDKHKRARLTAVMGALAVGSLLLHLRNHDDEDYQKLQDWQRDGYWFMKLGDKALFIPKPFELGAMATMTERAMDMATSGFSPEQSAEFRDALLRTLVSTFQLNPTPQMIKPSLEVWANYDTFRGRSIENYADQNVPAYMGYNENSTGFSKLASKAGYGVMNAIGLEDSALSPKQIDHMVRGYLGWFGVTVTGLPDLIAESTSDAPTKHWWERSLVRWAYRDLNAPVYTKQQEQFYEMLSDFKQHHTAYRQLINSGQSEEAKSYYVEHRDEINRSKQFDKMQRYLSKLNKQERMIYNNPKLSSDEKRWALDNIKRKKAEVAEYLVRQNPQ